MLPACVNGQDIAGRGAGPGSNTSGGTQSGKCPPGSGRGNGVIQEPMNLSLMSLEICVVALALGVLLADLWLPSEQKRLLGYAAAGGLALLLAASIAQIGGCGTTGTLFGGMYVQ